MIAMDKVERHITLLSTKSQNKVTPLLVGSLVYSRTFIIRLSLRLLVL
jgi:hypothetical protein